MTGLRWSAANHEDWKRRKAYRAATAGAVTPPVVAGAASRRLYLPWPPSGNTGTRHANGAHYLTAEHRAYRKAVAARVADQRGAAIVGRLAVHATFAPPDNRRRDLDNAWKVVGDALQHAGVYADDSAIYRLLLERAPVFSGGAVCVVVRAL